MRWIRDIAFRLKAIFVPGRMERELDEEMAFHLEMEAKKYTAQGLSVEEARRRAESNFGPVMRQKERARYLWGIGLVQELKADSRQTFRQLRRNPVFTVVAVLTLTLGIGGTAAIFSVLNGVAIKPLPFHDPHELVAVHHTMPGVGADSTPLSQAMYLAFREHTRTLVDIGLWKSAPVTITGLAEPERVEAIRITEGLLPLLGVAPILGRGYTAEEAGPKSTFPVILAHGYWMRRFGGDPAVVEQTIRINGDDLTIIGVTPAGVRFGNEVPDLFLPLVVNPARARVGNWSFPAIARLRPGVRVAEASRDLDRITPLATEQYPGISLEELEQRQFGTFVRSLKEDFVGEAGTALWIVFGTVGFVLLMACSNVANLFLVRTESRCKEVALREAMGASKWRLARQFLTESSIVGLCGGVLGLLLAFGGVRLLLQLAPPNLPRLQEVSLDLTVLLFTLGISLLAGLFFGAVLVLRMGRSGLAGALKEGERGSDAGPMRWQLRSFLTVSQVAMALVLLIGSGLMMRSVQALMNVPPGFQRPEEILTFRLSVPSSESPTADEAARTHQRILDQIARISGVTSLSAAASVAMDNWTSWDDVEVEGHSPVVGEVPILRRFNWITPGHFENLQNLVFAGRSLEWADIHEARPVAVVTENFAREFWGEPIGAVGKRLRTDSASPWREIVGVVGNVYTKGVSEEPPSVIYWPLVMKDMWGAELFTMRDLRYAVRTSRPVPTTLLPEIRQAVWSVNRNLPISSVMTLDEILARSISRVSFTLVMLSISAGVALFLGLVGVYGVISYLVSQRTREIGIRMALGARRGEILRMILRQGWWLAVAGIAIGLLAAAALTRLLATLLFGVSPLDALTYGVVSSLLVAIVLLATYLPARRAAAVDPTQALKSM